jgi:hypothetical protein
MGPPGPGQDQKLPDPENNFWVKSLAQAWSDSRGGNTFDGNANMPWASRLVDPARFP